jgi:hypothetical protein
MRPVYNVFMKTNERVARICSARGELSESRLADGALPGRDAGERRSIFKSFLASMAAGAGATGAATAQQQQQQTSLAANSALLQVR